MAVPPPPVPSGCPVRVGYAEVATDSGEHEGTDPGPDGVALTNAQGVREYLDPFVRPSTPTRYAYAAWTSPVVEPGFVFSEVIPTWHASTPDASWVEIDVRVRRRHTGDWSGWLTLARWADHDATMHPTSVPDLAARPDEAVQVDTDTVRVASGADAWQTRITLLRTESSAGPGPTVTYLGAMVSSGSTGGPLIVGDQDRPSASRSAPPDEFRAGLDVGRELLVPAFSQRVHAGRHAQWGGGGDVWCSPTCVAMVLAYWRTGPDSQALAWVDPSYPDRSVYHAVRHTWDYSYGAGNWSFNVAYAARFGLRSFVTRLHDLTEAEEFIAAGVPLVASVQVDPVHLEGAEYHSDGHLVVIVGFTGDGDVIVHDPAGDDRASVRRVYRRRQFEHAWRSGSGGIVYIIHTPTVSLPDRPTEPNW